MNRHDLFEKISDFVLNETSVDITYRKQPAAAAGGAVAFMVTKGMVRLDDNPVWSDEATATVEAAVSVGMMAATKTVHGDPKVFIEELRRLGYSVVTNGEKGDVLDKTGKNEDWR